MKKILLLLFTIVIMSGCGNTKSNPQNTTLQSPPTNSVSNETVATAVNNIITINNAEVVSSLIANGLKTNNIREVSASTIKPTPSDEQKKYFIRYFQLGNLQLALGQEKSSNAYVDFTTENNNGDLVGIWYSLPTDTGWKRFLHIRNTFDEGIEAKNNPFYIWNNNQTLHILLIDEAGTGSGEGNAKVLDSRDNGQSWRISRCFYYTPEAFPELSQRPTITQKSFGDLINNYLRNKNSNLVKEFTFNESTGNFEARQFNKEIGQIETIIQDGCHNIQVPYASE